MDPVHISMIKEILYNFNSEFAQHDNDDEKCGSLSSDELIGILWIYI